MGMLTGNGKFMNSRDAKFAGLKLYDNFLFFYKSVFYLFEEFSAIFINMKLSSANSFSLESLKFADWETVKTFLRPIQ